MGFAHAVQQYANLFGRTDRGDGEVHGLLDWSGRVGLKTLLAEQTDEWAIAKRYMRSQRGAVLGLGR